MNTGYIYLWRKIMDSSFYTNPNCCHLAIHLLLKVNHKEKKIIFNGQEITVKKGETITGRNTLSEETGLTTRNVRTCLNILRKVQFLTIRTTNRFSIISISKYQDYQNNDQVTDQQLTSKRPATDQPLTTNNNDKNVKNDNNSTNTIVLVEKKDNINYFINLFKGFNPSYKRFFSNKSQRSAITNLLENIGPKQLEKVIKMLPKIIILPYAPRITTPCELEAKYASLVAFMAQEGNKKKGGVYDATDIG